MKTISTFLEKASNYTLILLMLLLTVATSAQVLSRFVFKAPMLWTEEVSRMTFIWIALLGSSLATKHKQHLGLDLLLDKTPPSIQLPIRLLVHGMMMTVALIFVIAGWDFVGKNAGRISETTGASMLWLFIAAPISGALMLFYLCEQLPDLFKNKIQNPNGSKEA